MTSKLKEIVANHKHDKVILNDMIQSFEEGRQAKKLLSNNHKHVDELLKVPTKENVLAVKKYIGDLCKIFNIPFKDEMKIVEEKA